MGDPFMEARAVLLLEFGCPPLPIANGVRAESNQPAIVNSHDLLSTFLAQAYKQNDAQFNARRRKKQEDAEEAYFNRLLASDGTFASIYDAMRQYTKEYLGSYLLEPFHPEDIQVLPPDYISPALQQQIFRYCEAMHLVHFNKESGPKTDLYDAIKGCHWILCQRELRHRTIASQTAASSVEASV